MQIAVDVLSTAPREPAGNIPESYEYQAVKGLDSNEIQLKLAKEKPKVIRKLDR